VLSVSVSGVVVEFTLYITFVKVVVVLLDGRAVVVFDKTTLVVSFLTAETTKLCFAAFMVPDAESIMSNPESDLLSILISVISTDRTTLVRTTIGMVFIPLRAIRSVSNQTDTSVDVVENALTTSATYSS
jgi:hypothetical protein